MLSYIVLFFLFIAFKSSGRERESITKTCLYNFDPLKPHFYIAKLGFTGVYIIFLISAKNIDCGYSLEPPRWGGSNEYPQSMFLAEIWKISEFFIWKFSFFLVVKFSVYLNRLVFVMESERERKRERESWLLCFLLCLFFIDNVLFSIRSSALGSLYSVIEALPSHLSLYFHGN